MADGRTHDKITNIVSLTYTTSLAVLPLVLLGHFPDILTIFYGFIGTQLQRIMSPDLDVDKGFYGFYLVRKYGGMVIGGLWEIYWLPFRALIPHRNVISHGIVIGSIIRISYLVIPIWLISNYFGINLISFVIANNWRFSALILGFVIADLFHLFFDYVV